MTRALSTALALTIATTVASALIAGRAEIFTHATGF